MLFQIPLAGTSGSIAMRSESGHWMTCHRRSAQWWRTVFRCQNRVPHAPSITDYAWKTDCRSFDSPMYLTWLCATRPSEHLLCQASWRLRWGLQPRRSRCLLTRADPLYLSSVSLTQFDATTTDHQLSFPLWIHLTRGGRFSHSRGQLIVDRCYRSERVKIQTWCHLCATVAHERRLLDSHRNFDFAHYKSKLREGRASLTQRLGHRLSLNYDSVDCSSSMSPRTAKKSD